jgi:hypothetical protein
MEHIKANTATQQQQVGTCRVWYTIPVSMRYDFDLVVLQMLVQLMMGHYQRNFQSYSVAWRHYIIGIVSLQWLVRGEEAQTNLTAERKSRLAQGLF